MEVVIVTGLSGAGKSSAANVFEDLGYYCMDNIPPKLIPQFAELALSSKEITKIAVVTDVRSGDMFKDIFKCMDMLSADGINYKVLFLDSSEDVLAKRFKANRRRHPLADSEYCEINHLIQTERKLLDPIRLSADYIIDTSNLPSNKLRERIVNLFSSNSSSSLSVTVMSFGFKYGLPAEADLVLDVRCLDNPFYVESLKNKTGLDKEVRDFVLSADNTHGMLERYISFLDFSIPLYQSEGKNELIIAIGCTGGKHRSVVFTEKITAFITSKGYEAAAIHRDIHKLI